MGPTFLILAFSIVATYGDVYQLPPPGYLPPNHKYPDPYDQPSPPPTNHQQSHQTAETAHHLEPFATMEIFKERNQRHLEQPNYHIIPDNHKPVHVEVYKAPENQQQSEDAVQEGQEAQTASTVNRGSDLESALRALDFFNERSTPMRPVSSPSPSASAQYATAFPQNFEEEVEGRPSRYYPVQQNNFQSPLTDFYTPSFGQNANQKKLGQIVDKPTFPKKLKPKKKYSSKLQKFPKKYKSSHKSNKLRVKPTISEIDDDFSLNSGNFNSKLQSSSISNNPLSSKLQIKPVGEVEEFSMDTLKNKRRIPVSYYKQPRESHGSSGYGAELNSLNSFPSNKGSTHADFSLPTGGSSDGERVQFEMHGMDGPDSYKFGYDTGKGHNRHFRYEERDSHGKVKGHYGFYDQEGKMSMMHYEADPHTGFHAGPYHHPENHHEYN